MTEIPEESPDLPEQDFDTGSYGAIHDDGPEFGDTDGYEVPTAPAARPPLMKEKLFHVPVWVWFTGVVLLGMTPMVLSLIPAARAPSGGGLDAAFPEVAPAAPAPQPQAPRVAQTPPGVTLSDTPPLSLDPIQEEVGEPSRPRAGIIRPEEPHIAPPEGAQPVVLATPDTSEIEALLEQVKRIVGELSAQQVRLTARIEALDARLDGIQGHMETTDKAVRNTWWIVHKTLGPQYEAIKAKEKAAEAKKAQASTPTQPPPAPRNERRSEPREAATAQSVKERAERLRQSAMEGKRRALLSGWSVSGVGPGFAALRAPDGKDYVVRPGDRLGDAMVERIDGRVVVTSFGEIK